MNKLPYLSLVIPAYNEEAILEKNLSTVISFLKKKNYTWEVVVADDGSSDTTREIVKKLSSKGVRLTALKENQGKGAALKRGVLSAKGEYIVFTDADLSVSISYLDILLTALRNSDVAIASRRIKGAVIKRHQPFAREVMGRVFTLLTQIVVGSRIPDFTCGFKGFRRNAGLKVFSRSIVKRWSYDAEIIFLSKKFGYSISQIPIVWENREDTRVRLGSAVITSFVDLIKIRIFDLLGYYDENKN